MIWNPNALIQIPLAEFTPPVWFFCTTSFNHWLLIVNASCNFLIYVSVGDKFKTSIANFCQTKLGCCLQAQASPSESNKSVKSNTVPLMLIAKSDSQEGITAVAVKGPQIQVCILQSVLATWLRTLKSLFVPKLATLFVLLAQCLITFDVFT